MQQHWAYSHQVNLLASGANNPAVGSTGTGIYSSRRGALNAFISGVAESKLLKSKIPKNPEESLELSTPQTTSQSAHQIKLKRDKLDTYTTIALNRTDEKQEFKVCHKQFCCEFVVQMQVTQEIV